MSEKPERIHVTGGPGSGKSRLAQRLAHARGVPLHDLDGLMLAEAIPLGADLRARDPGVDAIDADGAIKALAAMQAWVSDGVYVTWSHPFLAHADVIVWMDPPWRVASYRIIARHVRLEIARKNRFPGWRRLYRFWRWSGGWYADRNEQTVNAYGAPNTRSVLEAGLAAHRHKLVVCRTNADIEAFVRECGGASSRLPSR